MSTFTRRKIKMQVSDTVIFVDQLEPTNKDDEEDLSIRFSYKEKYPDSLLPYSLYEAVELLTQDPKSQVILISCFVTLSAKTFFIRYEDICFGRLESAVSKAKKCGIF